MTTHAPVFTDHAMYGKRLLAVLPLGHKDLGKYLVGMLMAGKQRWGWSVSVLAASADTKPYRKLTEPNGEVFLPARFLEEADWERDPNQVDAVDRKLHEAEIRTGLTAGRVIMSAGHSIGRAYSAPFHYYNRYPNILRVLGDNREPLRVVRRFFRFADDLLERNRPDFLFFYHWGTPLNLTIWLAAQRRGIPCVALRPSKIWNDRAFVTLAPLMMNAQATERARTKVATKTPATDAGYRKIQEFRNRPVTIKYIASKWTNRMNLGFYRWHRQFVGIAVRQIANRLRGQDRAAVESLPDRLIRYYRTLFLSYYQQRVFSTIDEPDLAKMKYVYFPLHKEAELAQTFQASVWHDQRQTVRALAGALPFGYRLLIREHRLNYGRRRSSSYRELMQLPNVTLLDPFDSQFKYLKYATLVVTENGSTGWEGLMLKRRTLLLAADTFYEGSGLGATVTDPDKLAATIVELLSEREVANPEAYEHALASMVDAETESTFPMLPDRADAGLDALAALLSPLFGAAARPAVAVDA